MVPALAQLIPLAVAAALSSVPITATILILLSSQRNRSAVPFLIGWVIGMVAVVVAAVAGAGALPRPNLDASPAVIGIAQLIVGAGLALYGLVAGLRAIRNRRLSSSNRWLGKMSGLGPWSAFGIAFALNFRPKGLLIATAAGLAISAAALLAADSVILVGVYVVLAVSTVAVPIVITLAAPRRMEPWLLRTRDWLDRHGGAVTAVVMGMIGLLIALAGFSRLTAT